MTAIVHTDNVKHVPDQAAHSHSCKVRHQRPRYHGMSHVLSWGSQLSERLYQSMNIGVNRLVERFQFEWNRRTALTHCKGLRVHASGRSALIPDGANRAEGHRQGS